MGSIERLVTLREGAKPGIPKLEVQKIEQNSVHFTILVSEILVDPIELMELCPVERPKVDLNDSTRFFMQGGRKGGYYIHSNRST